MSRVLSLAVMITAVLATACASPAPPSAAPTESASASASLRASFQYTVDVPTRPLIAGERLDLTWQPHMLPERRSSAGDVQLCLAFFGPFNSVPALKAPSGTREVAPSCPPSGAAVATSVFRTTTDAGARIVTALDAPPAPGFYNVHQIAIVSSAGTTSATTTTGVVEVRAR